MIIYKTTNLINGKIYIGQDSHNNPNYFGSGEILKNAIKKYGKENFTKEILEHCNNKDELNDKEIYWVAYYDSTNKDVGYNICVGGQGGMILTDEEKEERGIYDKIAESHTGRELTDEHKTAIKQGLSKYKKDNPYEHLSEEEKQKRKIGKYNNYYGHTHKHEENYKEKYTTRTGITPENAYKVRNLETGEIFDSCTAAAQEHKNPNTARRAIAAVCKGWRKHYKKIKYEFIN